MDSIQMIHIMTNATRYKLLILLGKHPYCVKALAKKMNISEPAVSQQLKILKEAGVLKSVKLGYQTHYRIEKEQVVRALNEFLVQFSPVPEVKDFSIEKGVCSCEFSDQCNNRRMISEAEKNGE